MRLRQVATTCHWLPLLLINLISYGLTADYNKQDFIRISSAPKKTLIDTMMKKYSYPKNEVTAGVGYGKPFGLNKTKRSCKDAYDFMRLVTRYCTLYFMHHLHPFYYQGEKKTMYPCAVECGEWETMTDMDDSADDASSNIDVVTVRPDVASIEITTPKTRPAYKDTSLLRSKNKYKSTTSFPPALTSPNSLYNDYQDSKGADVKIVSQKANNDEYSSEQGKRMIGNKNEPNNNFDGSLYVKYRNALLNSYESDNAGDRNNEEYLDPVGESIRYNPPSFNADDDDDDDNDEENEATAHRNNRDKKFYPKRERIEEKYVKHNLREERLEDLRTNSFGNSGENDNDYSTDDIESDGNYGNRSADYYQPQKYDVDDYAAPESHSPSNITSTKPFRPSPPQDGRNGNENLPIRNGHRHEHFGGHYDPPRTPQHTGGYSVYDNGKKEHHKESSVLRVNEAHFHPSSHSNLRQAYRVPGYISVVPNYAKNGPLATRLPSNSQRVNQFRGKYHQQQQQEYLVPVNYYGAGYIGRNPKASYYNSYYGKKEKNSFNENAGGVPFSYHSYAPEHGYSPQSQEPLPPTLFDSVDGIRLVDPPQRLHKSHLPRHGRYPRYNNGLTLPVQSPHPRVRGQRINYRKIIPHRDGFTKVVKRFKTFVGHTPKRYV